MIKTLDLRRVSGTVPAIASKSAAHRLLIAAALADRPARLTIRSDSEDIRATVRCLKSLGAKIRRYRSIYTVSPVREVPSGKVTLDCGESGSTIRFLLPVAAALGADAVFTGSGRLPERPQTPLLKALRERGASVSADGVFPITVSGGLTPGEFVIPGNISSQFVTGLLLALPLLKGSEVRVTEPIESAGYIDLTLGALQKFGFDVIRTAGNGAVTFRASPGAALISPGGLTAEGDWSNAAFFICAGALSEQGLTVTGLDPGSSQGDRAILDIVRSVGADVTVCGDAVTVKRGRLLPVTIDARDIPDLIPCAAALCAFCDGVSEIKNAGRLRLKESDRLSTTAALLTAAGIKVTEHPDGLTIYGGKVIPGFRAPSYNDHRLCMAAAVLARAGEVTIEDAEAAAKSWPGFYDDLKKIGGSVI